MQWTDCTTDVRDTVVGKWGGDTNAFKDIQWDTAKHRKF